MTATSNDDWTLHRVCQRQIGRAYSASHRVIGNLIDPPRAGLKAGHLRVSSPH
jgi:hypothetical protein